MDIAILPWTGHVNAFSIQISSRVINKKKKSSPDLGFANALLIMYEDQYKTTNQYTSTRFATQSQIRIILL